MFTQREGLAEDVLAQAYLQRRAQLVYQRVPSLVSISFSGTTATLTSSVPPGETVREYLVKNYHRYSEVVSLWEGALSQLHSQLILHGSVTTLTAYVDEGALWLSDFSRSTELSSSGGSRRLLRDEMHLPSFLVKRELYLRFSQSDLSLEERRWWLTNRDDFEALRKVVGVLI